MNSKTGGASSSSRGPVVRTRVAARAPEVRVRFPEARDGGPSMLARWGRSVWSWMDRNEWLPHVVLMVVVAMVMLLPSLVAMRDLGALQRQVQDLRSEQASQRGKSEEQSALIRALRGELASLKEKPLGVTPSGQAGSTWLDNPEIGPPPTPQGTVSGGAAALARDPEALRGAPAPNTAAVGGGSR